MSGRGVAPPATTGPGLTLTGYAEVAEAYRHKQLRQALYDEGGIVMAGSLLDLHGDPHRARRRLENRLFRRATFQWFEDEVMRPTIDAVLEPAAAAGRGDLVELGYRAVMHLTALIAGVDRPSESIQETDDLISYVVTFGQGATIAHASVDRDALRAEVAHRLGEFDRRFVQPSILRRRVLLTAHLAGEITDDDLPRDVLTLLLRHEAELGLTADVILREVAFYLQAGGHSTANALTHALDDVFTWVRDRPDLLGNLVSDPRRLQRAVHESLRLHPASPEARRRSVGHCRLASGRELADGEIVIMDLMAANRDPTVFGPDADEYDPDRTLPSGVAPWGLSFGAGMHACIGEELDGGVEFDPGRGDQHLLGTVTLLALAFLRRGARPDPDRPAVPSMTTARPHFEAYPVVLG
jgi:cytochrome P450